MDDAALPRDLFDKLLYDLVVAGPQPVTVVGVAPGVVELVFVQGTRALLVRHVAGREAELRAQLERLLRRHRGALEVALVGGPAGVAGVLKGLPFDLDVRLYHLSDEGRVWTTWGRLSPRPLGRHLTRGPVRGAASPEQWEALAGRLAQGPAPALEEWKAFAAALAGRRPLSTWALAGAMVAMFALEFVVGRGEPVSALEPLGALAPFWVGQGEVWRLFSSAFLHFNLVHLGLNVYVLVMAGGLLERLLGPGRLLVLFCLSVLGGSLGSLVFSGAALTAGASGGLWGLLAAQGVLIFRPRGLLPQAVLPKARRDTLVNLGLNLLISLTPGISLSAHLGGGLAGAALLAGEGLLRGVPRPGAASAPGTADPRWLRPAAWLAAGTLAASLALALGFALL